MTSIEHYASEIKDVYVEALLAARLKGIEGAPAKRLAAENATEAINQRHDVVFEVAEVMELLHIKGEAPFSLVLSRGARWSAPSKRDDGPVMDQRMLSLLSQLNDAVHTPKA